MDRIVFVTVFRLIVCGCALLSATAPAVAQRGQPTLESRMQERFGDLGPAEQKLFDAIMAGEKLDLATWEEHQRAARAVFDQRRPVDEDFNFGPDREVRGDFISWLCTDPLAARRISSFGLRATGIHVVGPIQLAQSQIPFPLSFDYCKISGFELVDADLVSLRVIYSQVGAIGAQRSKFSRSVELSLGFVAAGTVTFESARIDGSFDANGGSFTCFNDGTDNALDLSGARIAGDLLLGKLDDIYYDGAPFRADGQVRLAGAQVESMNCVGGEFLGPNGIALDASRLQCSSSVSLKKIKAGGYVSFRGATIAGDLDMSEAKFATPPEEISFDAEGISVGGNVTFSFVESEGSARFTAGTIDGGFQVEGGQLPRFEASKLSVGLDFDWSRAHCNGPVNLSDARIGMRCLFNLCSLRNQGETALHGSGLHTRSLELTDSDVAGHVDLSGSRIDTTLEISLVEHPGEYSLDLSGAAVDQLADQVKSWPPVGRLRLDGLTYRGFASEALAEPSLRLAWLARQSPDKFYSQPYEQLAAYYRGQGDETSATRIMVAKEHLKAEQGRFPQHAWLWYRALGPMIGYGYEPWRAFHVSVLVVAIGAVIFSFGASIGVITPTKEAEHIGTQSERELSNNYPVFHPIIYSLDLFVPLIDLRQANYWLPTGGHRFTLRGRALPLATCLRLYLWLHIVAGWLLTSLLVVGLSGLIRA